MKTTCYIIDGCIAHQDNDRLRLMMHGANVAVSRQAGETPGPWLIENIQIEICYPFSMGKCPSNITQKKLPGKIAQKFAHVLQLNISKSDTDLNSNACPLWASACVKAVKYQVLCYSMCVS